MVKYQLNIKSHFQKSILKRAIVWYASVYLGPLASTDSTAHLYASVCGPRHL